MVCRNCGERIYKTQKKSYAHTGTGNYRCDGLRSGDLKYSEVSAQKAEPFNLRDTIINFYESKPETNECGTETTS